MGGPGSGPKKGGGSFPTEAQSKREVKKASENVRKIQRDLSALKQKKQKLEARPKTSPKIKSLEAKVAGARSRKVEAQKKIAASKKRVSALKAKLKK